MTKPHIVIVGAGFAGLACAKALGNTPARVTVIDRANYHLFVPLLYQVATAALSPADIARPIRRILGRYSNINVVLGEVTAIDTGTRMLTTTAGTIGPYDRLVFAPGSRYSYFGHSEWAEHAKGPRSLEDARFIRTRLLTAFDDWRADLALAAAVSGSVYLLIWALRHRTNQRHRTISLIAAIVGFVPFVAAVATTFLFGGQQ